jgi:hypothetical protein
LTAHLKKAGGIGHFWKMSREPKQYSSITILFAELCELTTLKNTEALDLETTFVVHEESRC